MYLPLSFTDLNNIDNARFSKYCDIAGFIFLAVKRINVSPNLTDIFLTKLRVLSAKSPKKLLDQQEIKS